MNQQPQQVVPLQHVCLSGSPACSGCNPCPECQAHVQATVLPSAFLGARMSETLLILHTIIGGLLEKGVDPRQLGIDLSRVFATLEEQGDGFFRGYVEGWGRMHDGMRTDPSVRNRIVVRNVFPDGQVDAPTVPPPVAGAPPQTPGDLDGSQQSLNVNPSTAASVNPFQQALEEQQRQWELEEMQEQQARTAPAVVPLTVDGGVKPLVEDAVSKPKPLPPITVAEVAAAGFVVDQQLNGRS